MMSIKNSILIGILCTACLVSGSIGSLVAVAFRQHWVCSSREFRLVGWDGVTKAALGFTPSGGIGFVMKNPDMGNSIEMKVDATGQPHLSLMSKNSQNQLAFGITSFGQPVISIVGKDGQPKMVIACSTENGPGIVFLDESQNKRMILGLDSTCEPQISLLGTSGKTKKINTEEP